MLSLRFQTADLYMLAITYDSSVGVLSSVGESGGEGGRAALVVVGVFAGVDGAVDGDGPHGGGVAVTVAVIILATVS